LVALDDLLHEVSADRNRVGRAVEEESDRPDTEGPDGLRSTKAFLEESGSED